MATKRRLGIESDQSLIIYGYFMALLAGERSEKITIEASRGPQTCW